MYLPLLRALVLEYPSILRTCDPSMAPATMVELEAMLYTARRKKARDFMGAFCKPVKVTRHTRAVVAYVKHIYALVARITSYSVFVNSSSKTISLPRGTRHGEKQTRRSRLHQSLWGPSCSTCTASQSQAHVTWALLFAAQLRVEFLLPFFLVLFLFVCY